MVANLIKECERWMGELRAEEGAERSKKKPEEAHELYRFQKGFT